MAARLSAGWLTSRCQTTAHSPSVCGVIRSGDTVGIDDARFGGGAGRAAVAADDAEHGAAPLGASSSARTRFAETFFSLSPPPTENTSTASRGPRRDTSSQAAKLVSQPSSFTRAVSSATLSVGV